VSILRFESAIQCDEIMKVRAAGVDDADDGVMRGWTSTGPSRDRDATPATGEVWAFYVLPSSLSRGTARALWSAARERLVTDGMTAATLRVFVENARARAVY
jgi:ribosomal protein S18 acetylase RimI-like enzyme